MIRRSIAALALAGIWLPICSAQVEVEAPPSTPSSTLLLRMSGSRTTLETAREVAYQLVERQIHVRTQLFDVLARHYGDRLRRFDQQREKLRQHLAKVVPQVQRAQCGRGGAAEIEKLRKEARDVTWGKDLTKAKIKTELDPRLERLRELVLVTPESVLAHDDELSAMRDEFEDRRDRLQGWFDLYVDTMRGLTDDKVGQRHTDKHERLPEPPPWDAVDDDIALSCLMALPLSAHDSKSLAFNDALRSDSVAEEFDGTLELNRIRIALGIATVRIDTRLADAARDHSSDMNKLGFFSHTSPVEGKKTPGQRAANFGTSGGAENIAAGQNTGRGAIRAWWYSPGHHKNMLGGHARTGLGQCENLWTQMFGS